MQDLVDQQQEQRSVRESLLKKQQDIQALTKDLALDESSYLLEETTAELQVQQLRAQRLWNLRIDFSVGLGSNWRFSYLSKCTKS